MAGLDVGEGQGGDVGTERGEIAGGEGGEVGLGAVEMTGGARVESGEAAAVEIVVDLGADALQCGEGGGRLVAEREDAGAGVRGGLALLPPGIEGGEFGEELVDGGLVHAGQARAVGLGTLGGDDLGDDLAQRRLGGGLGGHDAVAIEAGLPEDLGGIGGVFDGDDGGFGLAE